jgi:hypothetical protein
MELIIVAPAEDGGKGMTLMENFPSNITDRADRELKLAWPSAIRPIGLRDESIEFDSRRSRSAYQPQSSRPPSGFAPLGRLAR